MYIDQPTNGNPDVAQAKAGATPCTLFAAALHDLCFTSPANHRALHAAIETFLSRYLLLERDIDEI
jgi:hypothetical protein